MGYDSLVNRGVTLNPINIALVAGTTSTLTSTVVGQPILDGKLLATFAAITNQAFPTTDLNTGLAFPTMVGGNSVANAPGQGCVVVIGLLSGVSTTRAVQGPISGLDMSNNFKWDAPNFPSVPANFVPVAYIVCKARATDGLVVTVGTTAWTSFNSVFQNVAQLPSRPQVS